MAKEMSIEDLKEILLRHKEELQRKYGVKEIGIFGSYARKEQKKGSDVDILAEFKTTPDIFKLIDMEDYLKKILYKKVDLARKSVIRRELKKEILKEVVYI